MKKSFSLIFITLISITYISSQLQFERGYFINDDDERVECIIKNLNWQNSPVAFE